MYECIFLHFENAQNVIPITDALDSIGDGQVLQIGLKPVQEHIVYGAKVLSDDTIFGVIVDAGTGDVLYQGEGKSIQEIQERKAEMKARYAEGDFSGMKGDYQKFSGNHKGIGNNDRTAKTDHKFSESTGDPELDALRAQFVEKIQELQDARIKGDSDRVQELRDGLKVLRNQINDLRSN